MDYEKKYKNALERARKLCTYPTTNFQSDLEDIFLELVESEDERIRKEFCKDIWTFIPNEKAHKYIAWLEKQGEKPKKVSIWKHWKDGIAGGAKNEQIFLIKIGSLYSISSCLGCECDYIELSELDNLLLEKQGEQKPIDKVEPKFKVGDWITDGYVGGQITSIEDNYPCYKIADFIGGINTSIPFTLQDNYHLWTIQDANDGDVLVASDDSIFLFKSTIDCGCKHYVALTTDNIIKFNEGLEHCWESSRAVHPATKEQRDTLFAKIKEAGYEWDAEKKEVRKIEPKSAWSEEDEHTLQGIIDEIQANKSQAPDYDLETYDRFLSWLEKLKQRI